MNKIIWAIVGLVILGVLYFAFVGGNDSVVKDGEKIEEKSMIEKTEQDVSLDKTMNDTEMNLTSGKYEVYSPAKVTLASAENKVVLFFKATWCPTCRAVDADIKANLSKIPESLTILDVDYDKYSDLKKKYGITYQHTFVQVDKDGNQIVKWSGSLTLMDIVSKVK